MFGYTQHNGVSTGLSPKQPLSIQKRPAKICLDEYDERSLDGDYD